MEDKQQKTVSDLRAVISGVENEIEQLTETTKKKKTELRFWRKAHAAAFAASETKTEKEKIREGGSL